MEVLLHSLHAFHVLNVAIRNERSRNNACIVKIKKKNDKKKTSFMIFWVFQSCLNSVLFISEKIDLQEWKSCNWLHKIDIFNVYLKRIISETSRFSNEWLWILSCIFLTSTCSIDLYMVSPFSDIPGNSLNQASFPSYLLNGNKYFSIFS